MADLSRSTTPPDGYTVLSTTERFRGTLVRVRTEELQTGPDHRTSYDIVEHAVAAAAVVLDDDGRVLLVNQWRQAVGAAEWEVPAGNGDGDEDPQAVAQRELSEEAGVTAPTWEHLLTLHTSPGFLTERVEVYLATGASATGDPHREASEAASMTTAWVDLADAVAAVHAGQITSAMSVAGLLAAQARQR